MAKVTDHHFRECLWGENTSQELSPARGQGGDGVIFVWAEGPLGTPLWTLIAPFLDPLLSSKPPHPA